MTSRSYNPYQACDLKVPKEHQEKVLTYSQSQQTGTSARKQPFQRYVDFWFLAVCVGAHLGLKGAVEAKLSHKFHTGVVLAGDPERIELLEILAIAETNDPLVLKDPHAVIGLANQFAAGGLPKLIDMLDDGGAEPLWTLFDGMRRLVEHAEQEDPVGRIVDLIA